MIERDHPDTHPDNREPADPRETACQKEVRPPASSWEGYSADVLIRFDD